MDIRFNKPRVFLSHSKADVEFIERLHADLKKCQIEPWLDSEEIRHGQPWLDAIFEGGIPACDAVLVYFTANSLASAMVKKEMDAAILRKLKDGQVAFLPYVSEASVRDDLRTDIQALQVPVWNADNYAVLLPRVVAEIWRSYHERAVKVAVQQEQVGRLQAELELERLNKIQAASVFSPAEDMEFRHIWEETNSSNIPLDVLQINGKRGSGTGKIIGRLKAAVPLNLLLALAISAKHEGYAIFHLRSVLEAEIWRLLPIDDLTKHYQVLVLSDLTEQLMMYGFIQRNGNSHGWSPKSYRFKFWLSFNKLLPTRIEFDPPVEQWQFEAAEPGQ